MTAPQDDRPSRYEVVARVRNEVNGIREEPATITREEHEARLAGRIDIPDDGQAHSYDDNVAERQRLLDRAEHQIMAERAGEGHPHDVWDEARGMTNAQRERGDPEHSEFGPEPAHWRAQQEDTDRFMTDLRERSELDAARARAAERAERETPVDSRQLYAEVMAEAAREHGERADPDTARHVEARDKDVAAGRFDAADAAQRLIEAIREGTVGQGRADTPRPMGDRYVEDRVMREDTRQRIESKGRSWAQIADRDYRGGEDRLERRQTRREPEQR